MIHTPLLEVIFISKFRQWCLFLVIRPLENACLAYLRAMILLLDEVLITSIVGIEK